MRLVIDRFEGDYAICQGDDGHMQEIERRKIPKEAQEGDIIVLQGDKIFIDKEETLKMRDEIEKLMEELYEE